MKEISTLVASQTRNFREQKLTIGLDLGDQSNWYCVLDEAGDVLLERNLGTTAKAMKGSVGAERSAVVVAGATSQCASTIASDGDPSMRRTGTGAHVVDQHAHGCEEVGTGRKQRVEVGRGGGATPLPPPTGHPGFLRPGAAESAVYF
jgi:hypothetical protein